MRLPVLLTSAMPVLAILLAACAAPAEESQPSPITPGGAAPQGTLALAEELGAAGAEVEFGDRIRQDFLEPEGQILVVNGADVQVFEWPDAAQAAEAAATISGDGSTVGTTMITWVDIPHFYLENTLIALYVGSDPGIESLLAAALGEPIAIGVAPAAP